MPIFNSWKRRHPQQTKQSSKTEQPLTHKQQAALEENPEMLWEKGRKPRNVMSGGVQRTRKALKSWILYTKALGSRKIQTRGRMWSLNKQKMKKNIKIKGPLCTVAWENLFIPISPFLSPLNSILLVLFIK